jgi:hypothetical protein
MNLFRLGSDSLTSLDCFLECTGHVECLVVIHVTFTVQERAESADGLLEGNEFSWLSGENFRHEEWLGEESLDLSCSFDDQFIFGGQFVHTKNGDDILKGFIVLEELLDIS